MARLRKSIWKKEDSANLPPCWFYKLPTYTKKTERSVRCVETVYPHKALRLSAFLLPSALSGARTHFKSVVQSVRRLITVAKKFSMYVLTYFATTADGCCYIAKLMQNNEFGRRRGAIMSQLGQTIPPSSSNWHDIGPHVIVSDVSTPMNI